MTTRNAAAGAIVPLLMFSAQCAAVSTSIGETTVPEQAVLFCRSATNAMNGHVPAAAWMPPTTLAWARGPFARACADGVAASAGGAHTPISARPAAARRAWRAAACRARGGSGA